MRNVIKVCAVFAALHVASDAMAASSTWNNFNGDQLWTNADNWDTAPNVPGATDEAHLNANVGPSILDATVSVGRVVLDNDGALDITSTGNLDVVFSGTPGQGQFLTGNNSTSVNSSVNIDGTLTVAKEFAIGNQEGTGTMTIGSGGTVNANGDWLLAAHQADSTGTINVNGGTLNVSGFVGLGWVGTGTLNVNGGLVDVSGVMNLGVSNAISVGDINLNGGEVISAGLNIGNNLGSGSLTMADGTRYTNNGGFVQSPGSQVTINGSAEFVFVVSPWEDVANLVLSSLDWVFSGTPSVRGSLGSVVVLNDALTGDYDGDGVVDMNDYDLWETFFGSTVQLSADGNGNGIVDAADYTVWRDNLAAPGLAIPEPSSLALVGVLSLLFPLTSRRRV